MLRSKTIPQLFDGHLCLCLIAMALAIALLGVLLGPTLDAWWVVLVDWWIGGAA